jgi:hypothetical protein
VTQPPGRPRGRPDPRPPATRPPTFPRPADIIRDLVTLLQSHGLDQLYWSACALLAVLSITPSLTVWTDGHHLTWTHHGTRTTIPAHDTNHAAQHLARLALQPIPPTTSPGGPHHDPATR